MSRSSVLIAMVTVLLAGQIGAQAARPAGQQPVDAWVVTAHVKTRMLPPGAPDSASGPVGSALLRFTNSGQASRIEFIRNPNAGVWEMSQLLPLGMAFLVTPSDTASPMTVLDSAHKTYTRLTNRAGFFPIPFPRDPSRPPSPDDPVTHIKDITVIVDSIGAGPVISGHPTTHYRQTRRATIQTDAGPMMTLIVRTVSTTDLDIATNIPNAPSIEAIDLQQTLDGPWGVVLAHDLAPAMHAAAAKYPRGVVLHMEGHETLGTPVGTMTRFMTIDVDKWERSRVDASLFTVPATYTAAPEGRGVMP